MTSGRTMARRRESLGSSLRHFPKESRKKPVLPPKDGLFLLTVSGARDQKENLKPKRADQGPNRVSHRLNAGWAMPLDAMMDM